MFTYKKLLHGFISLNFTAEIDQFPMKNKQSIALKVALLAKSKI